MLNRLSLKAETGENGRRYLCPNGEWVPSVTTILSGSRRGDHLRLWRARVGKEEAEKITKEAAERGDRAHATVESVLHAWDQGVTDESCYDSRWVDTDDPYLPAIRNLLHPYHNSIQESYSEVTVWHPLGFAGRFDWLRGYKVLRDRTTYTIHDFKSKPPGFEKKISNRKYKKKAFNDYWLQLAAYAAAVAHCYGILVSGGMIEVLMPEGKYLSYGRNKDFLREKWIEFKERHALYMEKVNGDSEGMEEASQQERAEAGGAV